MGPHQTKELLYSRGIINKRKRKLTEWEKILANHVSDKGLVSKTHRNLSNSVVKKTNNFN